MCECVVFNISQGWNYIATAWFHSGGLNTNHHLTSLISPDIWTHFPRTTINREFKPRISQNKWQCAKLIKTFINLADPVNLGRGGFKVFPYQEIHQLIFGVSSCNSGAP